MRNVFLPINTRLGGLAWMVLAVLPTAFAQMQTPLTIDDVTLAAIEASADVRTAKLDLDAAERDRIRVEADPTSLRVALLDAAHAAESAADSLRNTEASVRSEAAAGLETLLEAEQSVRIAEIALGIAETEAQAVRIRQDAGAATDSDVARAEDAVRSAERDLRDAREARTLARDRLVAIMGWEGELPELADEERDLMVPGIEASLDRVNEHAALRNARRAVARAEANFDATNIAFTVPQAQIEAARDALQSARLRADDLAETVRLSIRQAHNAVLAAEGRLASAQEALATAEEDLRVAEVRFSAGSIAEVDVRRAELAVLRASANEQGARHGLAASLRSLEATILGGGA